MMKKNVLVVLPLKEEDRAYLVRQTEGPDGAWNFVFRPAGDMTDEEIAAAHIFVGKLPPKKIGLASSLEWLQLPSAGADAYTAPGVLPENVILTNSVGAYGLAVSEHMLASTLALVRRFPEYAGRQAEHVWKPMGNITSIEGSTVLVLGLGDIGGRYAQKMKALGAYVIGLRKSDKEKPEYVDEQYTIESFPEVIGRADIVSMVLPGGEDTENLMDLKMLRCMKKGSFLINCGRGNAVDLKALKIVLDEGHLAGAALDVTEPEPLPADDTLWDYENVLITPHVAGNFWLPQTLKNVVHIAGENLYRYAHGEPLTRIVKR